MRRVLAVSLALSILYIPSLQASPSAGSSSLPATSRQDPQDQNQDQGGYNQDQSYNDQEQNNYVPYSSDQLDNLLAPIALYPDPLLAQVLLAATFPDDIDAAARYVRSYGQDGIDDQNWDVSVKAVAHYPSVLYMMSDRIDWTTALGQAYVNQSTDVMSSVQRLRQMARSQGNLVTGPQDEIIDQDGYIQIWPANPQYIYVPQYDPAVVYYSRPFWGVAVSFGAGFLIGAWLNNDCDWRDHRVFYTGWRGSGWVERSRPYVRITNVYVNNRYTNIRVNRTVINRQVNFNNVNRFNNVHRNVTFHDHDRPGRVRESSSRVNNQVINRNIPNYTRVDQFRGRTNQNRPTPPVQSPGQRSVNVMPAERPSQPPPQRQTYQPPQQQRNFQQQRPAPPPAEQSGPHAFGRNEGNFPPRQASQRGQESRASRPAPPPRPAPVRESRPNPPQHPAPSRPSGNPGRPGRPR